jgi:hypothetical protein
LKAKAAAAEVENAFPGGSLFPASIEAIAAFAAGSFEVEETGFAKDAEMLGDGILGEGEALDDLGDGELFAGEEVEEAEASFFAEGAESWDALVGCHC